MTKPCKTVLSLTTEDQRLRRYWVRLKNAILGRDVIWGDPWGGATWDSGTMTIYDGAKTITFVDGKEVQ